MIPLGRYLRDTINDAYFEWYSTCVNQWSWRTQDWLSEIPRDIDLIWDVEI